MQPHEMPLLERLRATANGDPRIVAAADEIERLRNELSKIADPLTLKVDGIGYDRTLRIITTMQTMAKDALANNS